MERFLTMLKNSEPYGLSSLLLLAVRGSDFAGSYRV
jgi:hypothetical protein